MAQSRLHRATRVAGARPARCCALTLALLLANPLAAQDLAETIVTPPPEFAGRSIDAPASDRDDSLHPQHVLDPDAAKFDAWEPLLDGDESCDDKPPLRPFDWMRHWGFHHSSTDGRYMDKSVPLEYTSWLNRPYHVDWFIGPLLADNLDGDRVRQNNDLFGGLRLGWDFDYYWGVEWRFGWSSPTMFADTSQVELDGDYFVSDVDFVYYHWGDTKVRPYFQLGLGLTQVGTVLEDGQGLDATLLSMPLGVGVQFPLTHWLAGRLEVMDNLAFGNDGVDTMNNFSFTAGMEVRLGARPQSYWPWRSSRNTW
jgi:hypothetical protein